MTKQNEKSRCGWVTKDTLSLDYHDHEWGKPVWDDRMLFEFLILEGAQAGLNWITILKKREHYRKVFLQFDPEKIAIFMDHDIERLMGDAGIIRNRLKIQSAIQNAHAYLRVLSQFNCFADYIWQFVDGAPIKNHWMTLQEVPATTALSDRMSKDLKQRGFKFVGSTICYAYMQAVGMVNDHLTTCFCYEEHLDPVPQGGIE